MRCPCVKRALCGVVERGGVLERERWGCTVGVGINSAFCHWSGLGCLLAAEVMEAVVGGAAVDCGGVDGCGEAVACEAAFGAAKEG